MTGSTVLRLPCNPLCAHRRALQHKTCFRHPHSLAHSLTHSIIYSLTHMHSLTHLHSLTQALSEEPDYEDSLLQTAIDLLNKQHAYAAADSLSAVLASISNTRARQAKKQRTGAFAPGEGGPAGSSDAAAGGMATGAALDAQVCAGSLFPVSTIWGF